ncbi:MULTISPECIES: class I SAM-dependent methyltransferase [Rhodomicrobium]|uniref:class I SAM-dependent methyltransferase n=1 Tax=Rhodomicrobium TaxID=1068 RepID=UPI000B4B76D3|nr:MULTISPECIES: class I SAM-dependent methyltransferase [Rhodomicrobium]
MSGFSPEWLRLREPADHRARDAGLVARLAAHLAGRDKVSVVDFGCGTGSNLRALAPALPGRQSWRLVDYDPRLLAAARGAIEAWDGKAKLAGLAVQFETADLRTHLARLLAEDGDLVTAAALFDLVSTDWLGSFVTLLAEHRRAFYTVLIYDGLMRWHPAHPLDGRITAAFNAHQQTDKGFGPAAGAEAGPFLAARLRESAFDVWEASTPWLLDRKELPLILAVCEGVAQAARETGAISDAEAADWLASRKALERCEIGHLDILALPRASIR